MTKKIKWRLNERPTAEALRDLHAAGLLTKDEVREILFSLEDDEERSRVSLQEEIKFLRQLVEKLSNNSRVEIVKQIEYIQPKYIKYDWYEPYKYYCSNTVSGTLSGTEIITMNSGNQYAYTDNLIANSNSTIGDLTVSYSNNTPPAFSDIKTF